VISGIGSYVSIGHRLAADAQPAVSGGEIYPTWIRRMPIKPIRIFLQDGSNDLDNNWGNWFLANQQMVKAFEFANRTADSRKDTGPRYDVKYEWGDGAHSDAHIGAVLPDALRWVFRDSK
jgi:enterochelin esterase family protein